VSVIGGGRPRAKLAQGYHLYHAGRRPRVSASALMGDPPFKKWPRRGIEKRYGGAQLDKKMAPGVVGGLGA